MYMPSLKLPVAVLHHVAVEVPQGGKVRVQSLEVEPLGTFGGPPGLRI